jgi:aspartyl-tRNA synthetase
MERYGSDKPDLRFDLELADLSDIFEDCEFAVFRSVLRDGGRVKGFAAPGCGSYSRSQLEELTDFARVRGAKGLVTMALDGEPGEKIASLTPDKVLRLGLADPSLLAFCFIEDYPLFERSDEGRWEPMHHPFTAPAVEDLPLLDTDPGKVRARHYDFVCNGSEISSGSIRIHKREIQEKAFKILGYGNEEIESRFGHLLEALDCGAPPHGGIAPGIDRFVMLLAGEENIREVIAFPKTQSAVDLMLDSPSAVSAEQLRELHLKLLDD